MIDRFPRGIAVLACLLVVLSRAGPALRSEGRRPAPRRAVCRRGGDRDRGGVGRSSAQLLLDLVVLVACIALGRARPGRLPGARRAAAGAAAAPAVPLLQPALGRQGRRCASTLPTRRAARDPADRTRARRSTCARWSRTRSRPGPTRWRWRAATARRRSSPRSRPRTASPTPASRPGTRNHFALDLGVDRDDVVGALDAFVDGGERRVDLAEVNGRVFVNNVSLGLYAEAVQQQGYRRRRSARCCRWRRRRSRPDGGDAALRWAGPDGDRRRAGAGAAGLEQPLPAGHRPRLGDPPAPGRGRARRHHRLGRRFPPRRRPAALVVVPRPSRSRPSGPVAAGIDGEATTLTAPIRFASRPGALIVRIARDHPGASPATAVPRACWRRCAP